MPDAPTLLITDSIHHSAPLTNPSAPIDSTIPEDHFNNLPEDLSFFFFFSNDITNTPNLFNDSLSIVPVIKPAYTSAPILASPILGDSLPRGSTRISKPPSYIEAYK